METQAHAYLPHHMPRRVMCGPSLATHYPRSLFIETQTHVENRVDFKLSLSFAPNRAVSLECHDKLTVKPRHEDENVPDRGNPRETFIWLATNFTHSDVLVAVVIVFAITILLDVFTNV